MALRSTCGVKDAAVGFGSFDKNTANAHSESMEDIRPDCVDFEPDKCLLTCVSLDCVKGDVGEIALELPLHEVEVRYRAIVHPLKFYVRLETIPTTSNATHHELSKDKGVTVVQGKRSCSRSTNMSAVQ